MMVETILESSQDFGMSNGALPQWKRELLQRRAARSRPSAAPAQPPPPPPPPPPADDDEELRYGPGIVKRLKSRYLSLALRDAPRRRPSVLRRAASLEHLLDERPPPTPPPRHTAHSRPPRPVSALAPPAAAPPAQRRESVKRARSVDALSRLDSRDEPLAPLVPPASPPPLAPRPPPQPRAARPPRRPMPLLRDTERPPPDVVRSTLRKFESAPSRRAAPAARVSAVLRGLEGPQRTSTPEPREGPELVVPASPRTPSPQPPPAPEPDEPEAANPRPVSRAALDGIARAGSSVRYAFEAPRAGSHLPPLAAANPVLLGRARRIGVIRPMPARTVDDEPEPASDDVVGGKSPEPAPRLASPPAEEPVPAARAGRKEAPPAALVEPIPRSTPEPAPATPPPAPVDLEPGPDTKTKVETITKSEVTIAPLLNGHAPAEAKGASAPSKIGAAGIERAWSGSAERKPAERGASPQREAAAPWARGGASPALARRPRPPAPSSTSVVFNFSNRKDVPDYIENDGIVLRGNRRNRIKAGEPGVVVLRPEALAPDSESDSEVDGGPPSPLSVRFVNDNVLINGRSSMPHRPNRDRQAKLKLQFDDSLTRTFEYPSETSLCEEASGEAEPGGERSAQAQAPQLAESPLHAPLAANTHIASAALSSYTPHKTVSGVFQLGVTRHDRPEAAGEQRPESPLPRDEQHSGEELDSSGDLDCGEATRACAAHLPRSWSEARTHATDLLF